MVEPCCRLRFILEALEHLFVSRLLAGEHLHGHNAVEGGVERAKHSPHPATADKLLQLIGPKPLALQRPPNLRGRTSYVTGRTG